MTSNQPSDAPPPARAIVHRFEAQAGSHTVGVALSIAHVSDVPTVHPVLADTWLQPAEAARYQRFLVDSGRRDFLAGRIAAKHALQAIAPSRCEARDWEIVSGTWQRPSVRGPAPGLAITLAHAAGIGVALAFDDRWIAGIDIESLHHTSIDTIRTQVTDPEARWADASATRLPGGVATFDTAPARWLALWTAREAFGKLLGTGLGLPEALLPVTGWQPSGHGWFASLAGNNSFAIQSVVGRDVVVSLAVPAGSIAPAVVAQIGTWISTTLGR